MNLHQNNGSGAPHPDYAITALVLQGGGALGSYQAGVYEGLAQGGIHPNWVAGIEAHKCPHGASRSRSGIST